MDENYVNDHHFRFSNDSCPKILEKSVMSDCLSDANVRAR